MVRNAQFSDGESSLVLMPFIPYSWTTFRDASFGYRNDSLIKEENCTKNFVTDFPA